MQSHFRIRQKQKKKLHRVLHFAGPGSMLAAGGSGSLPSLLVPTEACEASWGEPLYYVPLLVMYDMGNRGSLHKSKCRTDAGDFLGLAS